MVIRLVRHRNPDDLVLRWDELGKIVGRQICIVRRMITRADLAADDYEVAIGSTLKNSSSLGECLARNPRLDDKNSLASRAAYREKTWDNDQKNDSREQNNNRGYPKEPATLSSRPG